LYFGGAILIPLKSTTTATSVDTTASATATARQVGVFGLWTTPLADLGLLTSQIAGVWLYRSPQTLQ